MSWNYGVFLATLVVLHFFLHLALGVGAAAPDLATIAVLLGSRRMNRALGTLLGAVVGLLLDALALDAFGADVVALAVVGYIGGRSRDFFVGDSWLFVIVYLFLGTWLHWALRWGIATLWAGGPAGDVSGALLVHAPLGSLYAALAGALALAVYHGVTGER